MSITQIITTIKQQIEKNNDSSVKAKLRMFLNVLEHKISITVASERAGISRKTYYKWWNRYKDSNFNLDSLKDVSRAPDTSPRLTPRHVEERLLQLHEEYPDYGPAKIAVVYFNRYNIPISTTCVYKVFKRNNLVKVRDKKPKPKHTKRYQKTIPGERMQMDVKYVPKGIVARAAYQYDIIDDCTRIKFSKIFDSITPANTVEFLKEAYLFFKNKGIRIRVIQTDNGTEFTYRFLKPKANGERKQHPMDGLCDYLKIRHALIPPATPQLNGKIERSHRTDQIEFYDNLMDTLNGEIISFEELQLKRKLFDYYYNYERIHAGINYLTPIQKLERIQKMDQKDLALNNALNYIAA